LFQLKHNILALRGQDNIKVAGFVAVCMLWPRSMDQYQETYPSRPPQALRGSPFSVKVEGTLVYR
jgi:hypothetical protein